MRTLSAMLVGMSVATCGVLIAGLTGSGFILLLGIVFFSLGEMWTGPKKNEYLGLIAPPGKKGLYLGYVNIPVGVGLFVGSYLAGYVYDNWGEKATLALKELGSDSALVAKAAQAADWSDSLEMVPGLIGVERDQALGAVAERLGVETAVAGERLRDLYRSDRGQTINLGLMYLAGLDSYRDRIKVTEPDGLAAHVDEVPDWIGTKRFEVVETVRDHVNTARADGEKLGDGDVEAMLWERFGADPGVLNNLACEYLAQNTELLYDAVAKMTFHDPTEEIPDRVGIDRTKAFRGLSAAMGADDRAVEDALQNIRVESDRDHDRYYVHLASLDHVRFIAIARKQWKHDVPMLRAMIEGDSAAMRAARAEAGADATVGEIAESNGAVQAALKAKDWSKTPAHAAYLLGLGPYEARALVAAEIRNSALQATQALWDKYDPQYKVWIPFAAIGVIATIALGIFGQMAKRWKDMNA